MPRLVLAKWHHKRFPTTEIKKLIPQMPYQIPEHPIRVRSGTGEEHLRRLFPRQLRLKEIAKSVTKLVDQERIELPYFRAYETRNYTERLIAEAMRYGDCHKPTMEVANFYLNDKTLVHKLFKVLVPRYLNFTTSFTAMHLLPGMEIDWKDPKATRHLGQKVVLELKGNPYPSIFPDRVNNSKSLLHNILLAEASKEYYRKKTAAAAEGKPSEVD
ncbi:54S ribosomal protein L17 mitochondrial [Tyrophagus putrescentiae]|nr:54S ribosomal protein L17 mitochondrial [Tyrophagus putrescentiae]